MVPRPGAEKTAHSLLIPIGKRFALPEVTHELGRGGAIVDMNIHGTADDLPGIFYGSGILPSQYVDTCRRSVPSSGERKLLFAVLEDAIRCFLKRRHGVEASRIDPEFIEVAQWLSSDDESGPFAFVTVCDALGIDPQRLRFGLAHHVGRLREIRT